MLLTAQTPQEFIFVLLMTEPEGRAALWNLTNEAIGKWKDDPKILAEVATELMWASARETERREPKLQMDYLMMSQDVLAKAKAYYRPAEYERFSQRFIVYNSEIETRELMMRLKEREE